jgi:hypothetical protein
MQTPKMHVHKMGKKTFFQNRKILNLQKKKMIVKNYNCQKLEKY